VSDTPVVPFVPPKRIVLEDTGERRFPKGNEIYVYLHPLHQGGDSPLEERIASGDDFEDWDGDPNQFAIYRIVEETP